MIISAAPNRALSLSIRQRHADSVGKIGQAVERLSTGKRINRPSDDPAGFVAAEQLRGELTVLNAKLKTIDRQEFSLAERASRLTNLQQGFIELRAQIVEATGDQIGVDEKRALQVSVDEALESLDKIAGDLVSVSLPAEVASGEAANLVDGDTALAAEVVEVSASDTLGQQAAVAASQRGLEIDRQLTQDQIVITTEALSQIEDADFAEETANLAVAQTLAQAAAVAQVYSQQSHSNLIGELLDRIDTPEA